MTEDVIRVDGVEYELTPDMGCDECDSSWHCWGQGRCARPKRKQTGWVCRACGNGVHACYKLGYIAPRTGTCACSPKWEPFYGKVVD